MCPQGSWQPALGQGDRDKRCPCVCSPEPCTLSLPQETTSISPPPPSLLTPPKSRIFTGPQTPSKGLNSILKQVPSPQVGKPLVSSNLGSKLLFFSGPVLHQPGNPQEKAHFKGKGPVSLCTPPPRSIYAKDTVMAPRGAGQQHPNPNSRSTDLSPFCPALPQATSRSLIPPGHCGATTELGGRKGRCWGSRTTRNTQMGTPRGTTGSIPPTAVLGTALALPSLSFPAEFPDSRGKQPPTTSHPSPNQVQHHSPKPPITPFGTTQGGDTGAQPEKSHEGTAET